MLQNNKPAEYILLALIVVILIIVSYANRKMSSKAQRKAINEYEDFLYRCNDFISRISEVKHRLIENYFVSSADEQRAVELLQQWQVLYNEISHHKEKIELYIKRASAKHYDKQIKSAEATLKRIGDTLHSLEDVEKYTITPEEWNYRQRIHRAEQFYRDYGTYNPTGEHAQSDDSSEREEYRNDYRESKQERASYEDAQNYTRHAQQNKSETSSFFAGCNTADEIEKRYKSLAKVYHPDMPSGDKETFQKLLEEYKRKRKAV